MINEDKPIACGLTAEQWVQLLQGDCAKKAMKAIHYLDGDQEKEVIKFLNTPGSGRKDWVARGYRPRFRNITAMIVEKSGRLFKDNAPVLDVFEEDENAVNEEQTRAINEIFAKTEWQEFFINLDSLVRLLKTGVVLVQYDSEEQKLVLDALHRGNCAVIRKPNGKIDGLIYRICDDDGVGLYRVFTPEVIIDMDTTRSVGGAVSVTVVGQEENPYGCVPVAAFYDTHIPRHGFWVDGGDDLVNMNEMVNIHITDNEQAISWMKRPMIYTNASFEDSGDQFELANVYGSPLPRLVPTGPSVIAGPDKVMQLDTTGVDSPFIDYKVPTVDLAPIDEVINNLIQAVAGDWSVRVKNAGEANASSGFQLVVEEIDNLELRKQRQRMFEAGFKRLFRVIKKVVNTATDSEVFTPEAELFVRFSKPVLPVDKKEEVEIYKLKLESGLISRVEYFMEVEGISRDEAEAKVARIDADNAANNQN